MQAEDTTAFLGMIRQSIQRPIQEMSTSDTQKASIKIKDLLGGGGGGGDRFYSE